MSPTTDLENIQDLAIQGDVNALRSWLELRETPEGRSTDVMTRHGEPASLFEAYGHPKGQEGPWGWLLARLASKGHHESLPLVLPFATTAWQEQALEEAGSYGHARCLQVLSSAHDHHPLILARAINQASKKGHADCVEALATHIDESSCRKALRVAASHGHDNCVDVLTRRTSLDQVIRDCMASGDGFSLDGLASMGYLSGEQARAASEVFPEDTAPHLHRVVLCHALEQVTMTSVSSRASRRV